MQYDKKWINGYMDGRKHLKQFFINFFYYKVTGKQIKYREYLVYYASDDVTGVRCGLCNGEDKFVALMRQKLVQPFNHCHLIINQFN